MSADQPSRETPARARRRDDHRGLVRDERGISFTLGYVLTVTIAVIIIAGVLLAIGGIVEDQRTRTVRGEATVVGDQTAAAVMEADRLVQRGNDSNVTIALRLPRRLADQSYSVSLRASDSRAFVLVRTESPEIAVSTPLANRTHVENTTVAGDRIRVVYRAADGELTLQGDGG